MLAVHWVAEMAAQKVDPRAALMAVQWVDSKAALKVV